MIPSLTAERIQDYWRLEGREEYYYERKRAVDITDMCDFAVHALSLDFDVDDPDLRGLAIKQADEWGVGHVG